MTRCPNLMQFKLSLALKCHFPDVRQQHLELLVLVTVALILAQDVRHRKLAARFPGTAQMASVIRRLERFFATHPITQADVAALVLAALPPGKRTLILDRTNWRLGACDLNVRMLAFLHGTTAIPLLWAWLPHGGSSSQTLRQDIVDDLRCLLEPHQVQVLLGDREFIKAAWFEHLWEAGMPFCLRLREDTVLDGHMTVAEFFADLASERPSVMDHPLECSGVPLTLAAACSPTGERVVIASNLSGPRILTLDRLRWRVECLFRHLKSGGFELERTQMTRHDTLDRLVCVLVIASLWSVLLGVTQPRTLKAHGRPAYAGFTLGLDHLTRALSQPLALTQRQIHALLHVFPQQSLQPVGY